MSDVIHLKIVERRTRDRRSPDVAIIGLACMFPKAGDVHAYWNNIMNKVNAIEEIPRERWLSDLYYDADPAAKDKINFKWGGFIPDVLFDPLRFGMPPNSLRSIDPLHLLLLMSAHSTLEDAGYIDRAFDRSRTSVIIGAGGESATESEFGGMGAGHLPLSLDRDNANVELYNRWIRGFNYLFKATMDIVGDPTIRVPSEIIVVVYNDAGVASFVSGYYRVLSAQHKISGGAYDITLELWANSLGLGSRNTKDKGKQISRKAEPVEE